MTGTRRIAIIGGTPAALRKARAAGFEVVWVHHPRELPVGGLAEVSEALLTDYREPAAVAELLRAVHARRPVERVVSMIEDGLETAATATDALGLPGTGTAVVGLLQDKLAFRSLLNARSVDPTAARIGHGEEDLRTFVETYGPTVVKPRYGSGSIGVRVVHGPDEVPEVASWAAGFGLHTFLMEEYLRGPEISVEAFSYAGRHVVLAHTAKETLDSLVEIAHVQPAALTPELTAAVDDLVVRMLDAVGLRDGPSHTEVKLTPDGPRLVESHNRRGGDRIADLAGEVYGIDIDALAWLWYAGRTEPVAPGEPRCGAAVRFLTAEPGVVEAVTGADAVRADPHVVDLQISVGPGDTVHPIAWSYDRSGLVIVRGADADDARERAAKLADAVVIRTTPHEGPPPARSIAAVAPRPDRLLGPSEVSG
ncbi:ATP-grasp domain-containing protein [Streptomyces sp. L2]|uniref:ATP-grasp domain-containing protein n=1 Tax=Streptomyces sp. L2 TaxID=2162665 RepID=UPI0010138779|nr:ATP-grasp domain-containing protein [Streptomyces sp. L2]